MLLQSLQINISALLKHHGIEKPDLESRLIVENVSEFNTVELMKNATIITLNDQKVALAYEFARKRCSGEPLAYILQYRNFWKSKFFVDNRVLIPRNDSETIVELFLQYYTNLQEKLNILDIGVGSGNLLISLLLEYKKSKGIGVDISSKAIEVAQINAYDLYVANRMKVIVADLFANNFHKLLKSRWSFVLPKFNCIISNPPYIDINDKEVSENVKKFEPNIALFAKDNGLEFYKVIFKLAKQLLHKNGTVIIEVGYKQSQSVLEIAKEYGFELLLTKTDMAKIPRALMFK